MIFSSNFTFLNIFYVLQFQQKIVTDLLHLLINGTVSKVTVHGFGSPRGTLEILRGSLALVVLLTNEQEMIVIIVIITCGSE